MAESASASSRPTRAFIGLFPSPDSLTALVDGQGRALAECSAGRLRVLPAESLHLTLAFLGNLDRAQLDSAAAVVEASAAVSGPIDAHSTQLLLLPERRARVIALAIDSAGRLEALAQVLAGRLRAAGLPVERRRFRAHVSLARVRGVVLTGAAPQAIALRFHCLGLYASEPGEGGPRYTPLLQVPLSVHVPGPDPVC